MTRARTGALAGTAALALVGAAVAVAAAGGDPAEPTQTRVSAPVERPLLFTLARVPARRGQPLATTVRDGALLLRLPCPLVPTALTLVGEDLRVEVAAGSRSACGGRSGADLPDLLTVRSPGRALATPLALEVRGDEAFATYEGNPVRHELLLAPDAPLPPPPSGVRSCGDVRPVRGTVEASPEQRCLLEAFEDGNPASLTVSYDSIEGGPLTTQYVVTGVRAVRVITDSRRDAMSGADVRVRTCADLQVREAIAAGAFLFESECL